MATLETPPTPLYDSNMFFNLAEMARIIKDNDDALLDEIANGGGGGGGATDSQVAGFIADPNSETRDELDSLYANQGGTVEIGTVNFASGYGNYAGTYTPPRVIKTNGRHCVLEAGLVSCPTSIGEQVYYTLGTIASAAFRPTDSPSSLMRMGVGFIYHGSSSGDRLTPVQLRVNGAGQIQYLLPSSWGTGNALYLIIQGLTWSRVAA